LVDQRQIAGLKAGLEVPAKHYLKAMRIRRSMQESLRRIFADVDVLVTPSRFGPASKISDPLDRGSTQPLPKDAGLSMLTAASNLGGFPALSLPCGFVSGLPLGIQLVGLPFTENTLVAVGKQYQGQTDWHRRHPAA
jgi:aspartyl-tRNA(Asn)/glutamyl-tRNA(Gln) amidotransferase subunit A